MFGLGLGLGLGQNVAASGGGAPAGPTWDTAFNSTNFVYTNSNLTATSQTPSVGQVTRATPSKTAASYSGEWACTVTKATSNIFVGFVDGSHPSSIDLTPGFDTLEGISYMSNGNIYYNGGTAVTGLPTYTSTDIIISRCVNGLVGFNKGGSWLNGYNPVTGAGGVDVTAHITNIYPSCGGNGASDVFVGNFGGWS